MPASRRLLHDDVVPLLQISDEVIGDELRHQIVRLLEPAMLLVMAVVTLTVVLGLLLPVFKMGSAVSGA